MPDNENIVDYKLLGERIKHKRLSLGLSQEKASEELGISESFYSRIERGERILSVETLVKISNFYNISIDFLLLDSKNIPKRDSVQIEIIDILENKTPPQEKYILDLFRVISNNINDLIP